MANYSYSSFRDISVNERSTWHDYISKINSGDYASAWALISGKDNMATIAAMFNLLFRNIVDTEQLNDPNFKSDRIETSSTPPANLQVGQIYFEV